MCKFVYVCMFVSWVVCVCEYECINVYVFVCVDFRVYAYGCDHVMFVHTCMFVCMWMPACMYDVHLSCVC